MWQYFCALVVCQKKTGEKVRGSDFTVVEEKVEVPPELLGL